MDIGITDPEHPSHKSKGRSLCFPFLKWKGEMFRLPKTPKDACRPRYYQAMKNCPLSHPGPCPAGLFLRGFTFSGTDTCRMSPSTPGTSASSHSGTNRWPNSFLWVPAGGQPLALWLAMSSHSDLGGSAGGLCSLKASQKDGCEFLLWGA